MSTHNIGFYEDLTKNIFESSLNIIKYAPYFFCWHLCSFIASFIDSLRNPAFFMWDLSLMVTVKFVYNVNVHRLRALVNLNQHLDDCKASQ